MEELRDKIGKVIFERERGFRSHEWEELPNNRSACLELADKILALTNDKADGASVACSDGLATLEHESCDLRCINVPTGGNDYSIEWVVIEHHMQEPREREIGRAATPLEAIQDAFGG